MSQTLFARWARARRAGTRDPGAGREVIAGPLLVAVIASSAVTAAVVFVPDLRFTFRQPELHLVLETAAALIGLLASYLVFGRYRRSRQLADLALCYSLGVFACSNLFFAVLPAVLEADSDRFGTWSRIGGQLLGALVFAAAAFAPQRRVRLTRRQTLAIVLSVPLLLAAVAGIVTALGTWLPNGVELVPAPQTSGRPRLVGDTSVLVAQLLGMVLCLIAAFGFTRKARATGDDLMRWLAVAAVFGAFARLNYFLYPSLYTDWVYSGDFFRLAFYIAIMVAAAREISSYWVTMSRTAVLEERRRIARELHDGLAQELAFIGRNVRSLDPEDPSVARISASAERALSESRRAIDALTKPLDEPFDVALAEAARETAEREGTGLDLDLTADVDLDFQRRVALIRIACEAIANAARHGKAERVRVALFNGRRIHLQVSDDGRGFDPAANNGAGFGLVSMRERAQSVGGSFEVTSRPGHGTTIEVSI